MKKTFLLAATSLFVSCTATAQTELTTIDRFQGAVIRGVDISSGFDAVLTQGSSTGASVTIPKKYEDALIFELRNDGILYIGINFKDVSRSNNPRELKATITCTTLESVRISGGTNLVVNGQVNTAKLDVRNSGGADFSNPGHIYIKSDLTLAGSGGGDALMNASVGGNADLNASGGSDIKITASVEGDVHVGASGGADASFSGETSNLKATASGGADVYLTGKAAKVSYQSSGGSKIHAFDCIAQEATATASGGGGVELHATRSLNASASGGGKVFYKGSPSSVEKRESGGGAVKPR